MTTISQGMHIVRISTPNPITAEQSDFLHDYVEHRLSEGKPLILQEGYSIEIVQAEPTMLASDHYARVNELLEANNRYQERYRAAEAKLRELGHTP